MHIASLTITVLVGQCRSGVSPLFAGKATSFTGGIIGNAVKLRIVSGLRCKAALFQFATCRIDLIKRSAHLCRVMCRNIRTLYNFAPPATNDEVRASALQFVRKLSGFHTPSKANAAAFNHAVDHVAEAAQELLDSLVTTATPRSREVEIAKARARNAKRFGNRHIPA
jgi:hypothetical protein